MDGLSGPENKPTEAALGRAGKGPGPQGDLGCRSAFGSSDSGARPGPGGKDGGTEGMGGTNGCDGCKFPGSYKPADPRSSKT